MTEQFSMLFGDTYSIRGYTPPFNREETLLALTSYAVQVGGGSRFSMGDFGDEDQTPVYENRFYIIVDGLKINGVDYGYGRGPNGIVQDDDEFDIVAKIVNQFLASTTANKNCPDQFIWLKENAENLNKSKRYWQAVKHLKEIEKEEAKLVVMIQRIARAKLVAQLKAFEVLEGRILTINERMVKWAEISGGLPYNPIDA